MTADGGLFTRCATRVVATIGAFLSVACASTPRNPALDRYPPGIVGRTSVSYYDVHGRTVAEVREDMLRMGPKDADGSFVGETRALMGWTWQTQSIRGGNCAIRAVAVSVTAQMTLPRWTPPPDTEPGLATEWKRFVAALETHEAGHKDIAAKAGHEIVAQLRGLVGFCSQITSRANDIARVIAERANEEQNAYDAATRHGITQGTSFGADQFRGANMPPGGQLQGDMVIRFASASALATLSSADRRPLLSSTRLMFRPSPPR
jgi:predicted secreted Zn-dependent protease